jgi:hypothetical protein
MTTSPPNLHRILDEVVEPGLWLLPGQMSSDDARVLLLAIGLQESRFTHRRQIKGPARSFYQFEKGGVAGVYRHPASRFWLDSVCHALGVPWNVAAIHSAIENNDRLATVCARLLLFTDPHILPRTPRAAWNCYLRCWRPGKPHPSTWTGFFTQAQAAVHDWRSK